MWTHYCVFDSSGSRLFQHASLISLGKLCSFIWCSLSLLRIPTTADAGRMPIMSSCCAEKPDGCCGDAALRFKSPSRRI